MAKIPRFQRFLWGRLMQILGKRRRKKQILVRFVLTVKIERFVMLTSEIIMEREKNNIICFLFIYVCGFYLLRGINTEPRGWILKSS
jgi:hypothetical protein